MCSNRPSGPPSMHAKQPRSTSTVARTLPPSPTRRQCRLGTSAYQTAPSASRQMPSGAASSPSSAQVRRSVSEPSAAIVNAVSRCAWDSATISVEPSGVTAMPFGNHRSSATSRVSPSGRTTAAMPGRGSSPASTRACSRRHGRRGSTTISFHGRPVPPYGTRSGPTTTPSLRRVDLTTVREPVDRERQSLDPSHDVAWDRPRRRSGPRRPASRTPTADRRAIAATPPSRVR